MEAINQSLFDPQTINLEAIFSPGHRASLSDQAAKPRSARRPAWEVARYVRPPRSFSEREERMSIREALAEELKSVKALPRDIALAFARDIESVSLPMLKSSQALTDADLIEILGGDSAAKQIAIAQRRPLSAVLCDAVLDSVNETAVGHLVANEEADLQEHHFRRLLEEYKGSEPVFDALTRRPNLPDRVFRQLVRIQEADLKDYLLEKQELHVDQASNLVLQTRERATASPLRDDAGHDDVEDLAEKLHASGRLTPPIVIRALCVGDVSFFEAAMARLAGVPLKNARVLIHDRGAEGFESLYFRTSMPLRLLPAFRAAVRLIPEIDYDGGVHDRERFVNRMIERMLTQFDDPELKMPAEDIDYLMSKLLQSVA